MNIAALVLAAGRSARMGGRNKLTQEIDDTPMVAKVVAAATASKVKDVFVVVGHEHGAVRAVLSGYDVVFVENPDYASGLSASLRCGLSALSSGVDGVVVCLGDMPYVTSDHINRLIAAVNPDKRMICVPTFQHQRGNPVLWSRHFFPQMMDLCGDIGARKLINQHSESVCEVGISDSGVLTDIDTWEDLHKVERFG
ncbi:MAG: nucleotidyltransferase family protein [Gammaproteobacteria bacterium]|nr:nucleotidyltransferase family protein [Gammaproteobacteria bacterium]